MYLLIAFLVVSCRALGITPEPTNTPTTAPSASPTATLTPTPTDTPVPVGAILAYLHEESGGDSLNTVDVDYGTQNRLSPMSHDVGAFDWSPDGQQVIYQTTDGTNDEVYSVVWNALEEPTRLLIGPVEGYYPSWSPDGTRIAFQSLRDEPTHPKDCGNECNSEVYIMDVDGSNVIRITENETPDFNIAWRPMSK